VLPRRLAVAVRPVHGWIYTDLGGFLRLLLARTPLRRLLGRAPEPPEQELSVAPRGGPRRTGQAALEPAALRRRGTPAPAPALRRQGTPRRRGRYRSPGEPAARLLPRRRWRPEGSAAAAAAACRPPAGTLAHARQAWAPPAEHAEPAGGGGGHGGAATAGWRRSAGHAGAMRAPRSGAGGAEARAVCATGGISFVDRRLRRVRRRHSCFLAPNPACNPVEKASSVGGLGQLLWSHYNL
jgi:hypothetical protein